MKHRAVAKVFKNGRSQAVRIPKEFRFDCDEVFVERRGRSVVLTPKRKFKSWEDYFENRTATLSDDFALPDDPPPEPIEGF